MGTKSDILKRGGAPVHLSLSFLHVQLRLYSFLTYMTHVSKYVSNRLHQVKYFKCYCYNHTWMYKTFAQCLSGHEGHPSSTFSLDIHDVCAHINGVVVKNTDGSTSI